MYIHAKTLNRPDRVSRIHCCYSIVIATIIYLTDSSYKLVNLGVSPEKCTQKDFNTTVEDSWIPDQRSPTKDNPQGLGL